MNAAQCLVSNYHGYLKFTKRHMSSPELAEDILHNIYLYFIETDKSIENPNYILKVIYFRCKSFHTYESRYVQLPDVDYTDDRYSTLERMIYSEEYTNNKISTASLNSNNSSGYMGVIYCTERSFPRLNKRWKARIKINGKTKSLGYFSSAIEAAEAYDKEAVLHNRQTNFGE